MWAARAQAAIASGASVTPAEYICPKCRDTGQIIHRMPDGFGLTVEECECSIRRRSMRRIERSGLADVISRYTFDAFLTPDEKTRAIKSAALKYVTEDGGRWFVIVGRPGSGKTHICTAIVGKLIEQGRDCRYMLWRDAVRELKALSMDAAGYRRQMDAYKRVDVLYIDDFLKGRSITDADLNIAFELLNARYNQDRKTLISGEHSIEEIMNLDEAIGSRIYERCKGGYCFHSSDINHRLAGGGA